MTHHEHDHCSGVGGVYQTLDEIQFAKGPWASAMYGDLHSIKKYLEKGGEPSATDTAGYTPLHYASRAGNFSICKELIAYGACVNYQTRSGKSTALHRAASQAHPSVVELLLQRGADAKAVDEDGKTPLHKAAEGNCAESCRLLIKAAPETQKVLDKKVKYPKDYVKCTHTQKEAYKALHWT